MYHHPPPLQTTTTTKKKKKKKKKKKDTLEEVLDVALQGELNEKGFLLLLWLVRQSTLVSPPATTLTDTLVLIKSHLTGLAVLVDARPPVVCAEETKKLWDRGGQKIVGKK